MTYELFDNDMSDKIFSVLLAFLFLLSYSLATPTWSHKPREDGGASHLRTCRQELPARNITALHHLASPLSYRQSVVGAACLVELSKSKEKDYFHPFLEILMIDCVRTGIIADETHRPTPNRRPRASTERLWDELDRVENKIVDQFKTPIALPILHDEDERRLELGMMSNLVLGRKEVFRKLSMVEKMALLDQLKLSLAIVQKRQTTSPGQIEEALVMIDKIEQEMRDDVCVAR